MSDKFTAAKARYATLRAIRIAECRTKLRPHEQFIESWAVDCSPCPCEGTHIHDASGLPCISIARGRHVGGYYDRCLECGLCWTARTYRWETTKVVPMPTAALPTHGGVKHPTGHIVDAMVRYQRGESLESIADDLEMYPNALARNLRARGVDVPPLAKGPRRAA